MARGCCEGPSTASPPCPERGHMPSQLLTTHRRTCMRPAEDQEDYSADFTFPSQEWASVPGWIGPGEGLGKQVAAAWWRAARLPKSSLRARIYVRNVSRGKSLNPTKSNLWGDLAMGPPRASYPHPWGHPEQEASRRKCWPPISHPHRFSRNPRPLRQPEEAGVPTCTG